MQEVRAGPAAALHGADAPQYMPRAPQMPPASQPPQMVGPVPRMPPAMAPRMPEPRPPVAAVPRSDLRPVGPGGETGASAQAAAAGNNVVIDSVFICQLPVIERNFPSPPIDNI